MSSVCQLNPADLYPEILLSPGLNGRSGPFLEVNSPRTVTDPAQSRQIDLQELCEVHPLGQTEQQTLHFGERDLDLAHSGKPYINRLLDFTCCHCFQFLYFGSDSQ